MNRKSFIDLLRDLVNDVRFICNDSIVRKLEKLINSTYATPEDHLGYRVENLLDWYMDFHQDTKEQIPCEKVWGKVSEFTTNFLNVEMVEKPEIIEDYIQDEEYIELN